MEPSPVTDEWRHGWPVVGAGLVGLALSSLHLAPLGVLMSPLGKIFGWGRSEISAGMMILTTSVFLLGPVVGMLIPRLGIRTIVLASTICYSMGMVMLGFCTADIRTWYLGWVVLGISYAGICPLVWTTAITRSFARHRGLALSVALSGTGVTAFVAPPATVYALEHWGWRSPFFLLAGFILIVALPAVLWLMRNRPEFDRADARPSTDPAEKTIAEKRSLRDAVANIKVWQLVIASLLIAASVGMIFTHIQAMLQDAGASAIQAATYFSVVGPSLILGRIGAGLLLDRLPIRIVASGLFLLPGFACLMLLAYDGSTLSGFLVCIVFGISYGAETDVLAYLTSRYFDARDYPLIYSLVYGVFGLSYGISGVLGGAAFDRLGSYDMMLYALIAGVLIGVAAILAMGRAPPRQHIF